MLLNFAGRGSASPAFMKTRYSRVGGLDDDHADDGTSPAGGEYHVLMATPAGDLLFCRRDTSAMSRWTS